MQPVFHTQSRAVRWLIAPGRQIDGAIANKLTSGLFTSIPIFLGGVINSIVVAAIATSRHPTAPFITWLATELMLGVIRLFVLIAGRRAQAEGRETSVTLPVILSCCWAGSVGFGAFISLASNDWVLATITCLSAAAMVSGICLRNFCTPRLAIFMMMLSLLPCAVAALFADQAIIMVITVQLPIYMVTIGAAAFRINSVMVDRMIAQDALEKSEAFNRSIMESSPDYTLLLDENRRIQFCNQPQGRRGDSDANIGIAWLDLLPPESRLEGIQALDRAAAGETPRLTVAHSHVEGRQWFDLAVSRVADDSRMILIVARDITHQKASEERALWMANHDPLTGLPNRIVLQNHLQDCALGRHASDGYALLVLDIDNFKFVNDTLGHDAGDALLCTFASRLRSAVRAEDLIARLGGDEFAIVLQARKEQDVHAAAEKIYAALHLPFAHEGRLIECNASIGASLSPAGGTERSELMKSADIALYSAKAAGRGQLKLFENSMRNEFRTRTSMMASARDALTSNNIVPHYQPKVCLRTGEIVGFESLLRWRDAEGRLRPPAQLRAAFDDPVLSQAISKCMIDQTLADIGGWIEEGVEFGHVAINVAAAQFRSGKFSEELLETIERHNIAPASLQIEVTETVFLGRGADHVERALRQLSRAGLRIALDDFGTGYASLAHLMQFPVDALKIDKSFIRGIGSNEEAEAITKAIVTLGHSLGIEIIAEGVETVEQEIYLIGLGCETGQGYLYSRAAAADAVREMKKEAIAKRA